MMVFKVHVEPFGWYYTQQAEMIASDVEILRDEGSTDDRVTVELVEMTQEEFDNLPEFDGF